MKTQNNQEMKHFIPGSSNMAHSAISGDRHPVLPDIPENWRFTLQAIPDEAL